MAGLINTYNLKIGAMLSHKSNGKKIVLSGEPILIEQGQGTFDYLGFPELDISGNTLYLSHGRTPAHSNNSQGSSVLRTAAATGLNFDNEKTLFDLEDFEDFGGDCFGLGYNGRIFMFCFDRSETGIRIPYVRTSDDGGNTMSDPVQMITTFPGTDFTTNWTLNGPGKILRYQNLLLKPMYGRVGTSGNRGCFIIASDDNGDNWYHHSTVLPPVTGIGNMEEPTLAEFDGILICLMRDDPGGKSWFSYSLNGGKRWAYPESWNLSVGKNGVAFTPNGTLFSCGRDHDTQRTIFTYSNDMGKTRVSDFIWESENPNMYSGAVWIPQLNKGLIVFSEDTNFPSGPTNLYAQYVEEVNV